MTQLLKDQINNFEGSQEGDQDQEKKIAIGDIQPQNLTDYFAMSKDLVDRFEEKVAQEKHETEDKIKNL